MTEHNPISIRIDGDSLYANSSLLGVVSINGGENITLDNSGSVINVVQDPSFTSLTVNGDASFAGDLDVYGDLSANTATFESDVTMNTDLDVIGDLSANTATFSGDVTFGGAVTSSVLQPKITALQIFPYHHGDAQGVGTGYNAYWENTISHNFVAGQVLLVIFSFGFVVNSTSSFVIAFDYTDDTTTYANRSLVRSGGLAESRHWGCSVIYTIPNNTTSSTWRIHGNGHSHLELKGSNSGRQSVEINAIVLS